MINVESQTKDLCALMSSLVREMVSDPDAVCLSSDVSPDGLTIIRIKVAPGRDVGKVIGKQGRTARSLRIILQAIVHERSLGNYHLDIDENTD